MKSLRDIQKIVKEFKVQPTSEMRRKVLDEALALQANRKPPRITDIDRWRIILKNRTTKYAAATMIMVAVLIGFNMFSATSAWAIEQTVEVLRDIKGVYLSGISYYPGGSPESFEIWARPNCENPNVSGDFRLREGDRHIAIASETQNQTYVYTRNAQQNVVYTTEGLNRRCELFPTSDLFSQFKEIAVNWKEEYRKDPETGRDCVFVTFEGPPVNTARFWLLQFDLETKLPTRLSVWWDNDYSGQPHFDFTTITYNPEMSDDLFEFTTPPDTQVIDCSKVRQRLDNGTDCGIEVDNLTTENACKKVATEYWQAVIDQDISRIQYIRPLAIGSEWDRLAATYQENRPVMLMNISGMNHLNDPGTFAEVTCIVTTKESKTATSVLNIELRQTSRGKIGVVAGVVGPELSIVN